MTPANVTFHPGASEDYAAAYCWYYDRGPTLAVNFESEVERGVRLISQNPSRWPKFDNRRRRFIVRKFPYSIIYELNDGRSLFSPSLTANGVPITGKNAAQLEWSPLRHPLRPNRPRPSAKRPAQRRTDPEQKLWSQSADVG